MAGQTPALQQNLQSSEKSRHFKEKSQCIMNTLYKTNWIQNGSFAGILERPVTRGAAPGTQTPIIVCTVCRAAHYAGWWSPQPQLCLSHPLLLHSCLFSTANSQYRVLIKYCVFSLKFCDFSELCQFCCSAGVLPIWCVYTNWHRGKQRKAKVRNISKYSKKHNI